MRFERRGDLRQDDAALAAGGPEGVLDRAVALDQEDQAQRKSAGLAEGLFLVEQRARAARRRRWRPAAHGE